MSSGGGDPSPRSEPPVPAISSSKDEPHVVDVPASVPRSTTTPIGSPTLSVGDLDRSAIERAPTPEVIEEPVALINEVQSNRKTFTENETAAVVVPVSGRSAKSVVEFRVKYPVVSGQRVRVCGSCPELGSWNAASAPELKVSTDGIDGNVAIWSNTVELTPDSLAGFRYQYVVTNDFNPADVIWEGGEPRVGVAASGPMDDSWHPVAPNASYAPHLGLQAQSAALVGGGSRGPGGGSVLPPAVVQNSFAFFVGGGNGGKSGGSWAPTTFKDPAAIAAASLLPSHRPASITPLTSTPTSGAHISALPSPVSSKKPMDSEEKSKDPPKLLRSSASTLSMVVNHPTRRAAEVVTPSDSAATNGSSVSPDLALPKTLTKPGQLETYESVLKARKIVEAGSAVETAHFVNLVAVESGAGKWISSSKIPRSSSLESLPWRTSTKALFAPQPPTRTFYKQSHMETQQLSAYRLAFLGLMESVDDPLTPLSHEPVLELAPELVSRLSSASLVVGTLGSPIVERSLRDQLNVFKDKVAKEGTLSPQFFVDLIHKSMETIPGKVLLNVAAPRVGKFGVDRLYNTVSTLESKIGAHVCGTAKASQSVARGIVTKVTFPGGPSIGFVGWTRHLGRASKSIGGNKVPSMPVFREEDVLAVNWAKVKNDYGLHMLIGLPTWGSVGDSDVRQDQEELVEQLLAGDKFDALFGTGTGLLNSVQVTDLSASTGGSAHYGVAAHGLGGAIHNVRTSGGWRHNLGGLADVTIAWNKDLERWVIGGYEMVPFAVVNPSGQPQHELATLDECKGDKIKFETRVAKIFPDPKGVSAPSLEALNKIRPPLPTPHPKESTAALAADRSGRDSSLSA